jgi:hypothetical protein
MTHFDRGGRASRLSTQKARVVGALSAALAFLAGCGSGGAPVAADPPGKIRVYFLGGQSNMEGFGFVADLSQEQRAEAARVMIFNGRMTEDGEDGGGRGVWAALTPGHGTGFSTDGRSNALSDRFGPELSFGQRLAERKPDGEFAIIKYARGGTGLIHGVSGYGSWDPEYSEGNGRNQYDNALTALETAMSAGDIDRDDRADLLVPAGIIWMQGEADAYENPAAAANYDQNLARLIGLLRGALGDDTLPVVIGRIADSGSTPATRVMAYSPDVQEAQHRFVENDSCAAIVTVTEDFDFLPDGWHYTSQDYIHLGRAFADAAIDLEQRCRAG